MAYDEELAKRIRALLESRSDLGERKMFGGIGFLIAGNMCCGVHGSELIVRVGRDEAGELMRTEKGARPMDITGRPMRGWLLVASDALTDDPDLERWVRRAEAFASKLPPKTPS
jgi:TfoX/Sxy family transcriptional regulator of competence genes